MVTLNSPPVIGIDDDKITQRQAAQLLGVSFPTASRYMTAGRHGCRLPSAKIGGKRLTSREAVSWFFEAIQLAEMQNERGSMPEMESDFDPEAEAEIERVAEAEGL